MQAQVSWGTSGSAQHSSPGRVSGRQCQPITEGTSPRREIWECCPRATVSPCELRLFLVVFIIQSTVIKASMFSKGNEHFAGYMRKNLRTWEARRERIHKHVIGWKMKHFKNSFKFQRIRGVKSFQSAANSLKVVVAGRSNLEMLAGFTNHLHLENRRWLYTKLNLNCLDSLPWKSPAAFSNHGGFVFPLFVW